MDYPMNNLEIKMRKLRIASNFKLFREMTLDALMFGQAFIGGTTLDCIIWSLVDTHSSATFGFGLNHIGV